MKKFKILSILTIFAILIASPFLVRDTFAAYFGEEADNVVVDEMIDDDLYVSGGKVVVEKDVNGDLIVSGGQVTIEDDIYGHAIIAGGKVTIEGDVSGSIFAAGGDITINGDVGEDVNAAGGIVNISGDVYDDVRIAGSSVNIESSAIGGDLFVGAAKGDISDNTNVDGDRYVNIEKKSTFTVPKMGSFFRFTQRSVLANVLILARRVAVLIGWLIVGMLLFKIAPVKSQRILKNLTKKDSTIKSLMYGGVFYLTLLLLIPLILVLLVTGIGQPVIQVGGGLLAVATSVAAVYSSTALSKTVLKRAKKSYKGYKLALVLGITTYQILTWIPAVFCCLSIILKIFMTVWGVGGILYTKRQIIEKK